MQNDVTAQYCDDIRPTVKTNNCVFNFVDIWLFDLPSRKLSSQCNKDNTKPQNYDKDKPDWLIC